jgi:modulator of FtsH protease HflK
MNQEAADSFHEQGRILLKASRRILCLVFCLAFFCWLTTCFIQVKVQDTGVLLHWGRVINKRIEPGLFLKVPWPVQEVATVRTRAVRRVRTGFGADPESIREFEEKYGTLTDFENSTLLVPYVLTGDKNMLHIKVVLGYRVSDPETYLYRVAEVESVLTRITAHGILTSVSFRNVDELLTSGKVELRQELMEYLKVKCQQLDLGLEIVSVEIKKVRPPSQTEAAFKSVINAQEEQRELLHQAASYRNKILPETRASAHTLIQEAISQKNKRISIAQGKAKRFSVLAEKYVESPELTRERLRLETVEELLPDFKKYVVDNSAAGGSLRLRLWNDN